MRLLFALFRISHFFFFFVRRLLLTIIFVGLKFMIVLIIKAILVQHRLIFYIRLQKSHVMKLVFLFYSSTQYTMYKNINSGFYATIKSLYPLTSTNIVSMQRLRNCYGRRYFINQFQFTTIFTFTGSFYRSLFVLCISCICQIF